MAKTYNSFDEIENDLKKISLEQKIALEELKIVKGNVEQALRPFSILNSVYSIISKYGILLLIKKFFR